VAQERRSRVRAPSVTLPFAGRTSLRGEQEALHRVVAQGRADLRGDGPTASLNDADRVARDILEERNFPRDSRQEASEGVGLTHPGVVEDFRETQRIHQEVFGSRESEWAGSGEGALGHPETPLGVRAPDTGVA
jgi:hypothetical protein